MKRFASWDELMQSNLMLWVLSFVLALGLWVFVVGGRDQSVIKDFDVRLEFLNAPAGLTVNPSTRQVTVTLQGARSALAALENGKLVGDVDLVGQDEGMARLPVRVTGNGRVDILQVSPSTVDVELVRMIERQVPLRLKLPEGAPKGFGLSDAHIEPESITVRARESDLKNLEYFTLEPTLDQLQNDLPLLIAPELPKGWNADTAELAPSKVRLSGRWGKGLPQGDLSVRPDLVGALPDGLSLAGVDVTPSTARVEAPAEILKTGNVSVSTERVDLSKVRRTSSMDVNLVSPSEPLKLLSPKKVKLTINVHEPGGEKLYEALPLELKGDKSGQWRLEPEQVDVRVRFADGVDSSRSAEQLGLKPELDLTNVVFSPLRVPVRIALPPGVISATAEPATVKVTKGEK